MEECQKVVLFGDSLLMSAVWKSFAGFPSIEVITRSMPSQSLLLDLEAAQASVVIFDLADASSQTALSLIESHPHLLIIGLDSAGEKLILLSGRKAHTMTANRLVQLIDHLLHENGGEPEKTTNRLTGWNSIIAE